MTQIKEILSRIIFAFLFVRKFHLDTKGEVSDEALTKVGLALGQEFRLRVERAPGKVSLRFIGWGLPITTRLVSAERIGRRKVLITNSPSHAAAAFGIFVMCFIVLFVFISSTETIQCFFRIDCSISYYYLIVFLSPVLIYIGLVFIYWLQYLPSRHLLAIITENLTREFA